MTFCRPSSYCGHNFFFFLPRKRLGVGHRSIRTYVMQVASKMSFCQRVAKFGAQVKRPGAATTSNY